MRSACWLALVDARPDDVVAGAEVDDGPKHLVAWRSERPPVPWAAKVDPRAIDPGGGPGRASLVLAPDDVWLLFDDVAVSRALRAAMSVRPVDVVSTLVVGDDRFVGALTAILGDDDTALDDDPFATMFPARRLRLGPGLLGRTPTPVGPGIQRYGAANPWPWDRFA